MPVGISPLNILKYTGPKRGIPPIVEGPRVPLVGDTNYPIGTFWRIEKNPQTGSEGDFYLLVKFETNGDATWQKLATTAASSNLDTLSGDTGTSPIVPDGAGNIAITGEAAQGVSTDGGTSALEITVANATDTQKGVATFDENDFVVTDGDVALASSTIVLTLTGDNLAAAGPTAGNFRVAGANGIVTNTSAGNLTITGSNVSVNTVNHVTTTTVTMVAGVVYIMNNASRITATLPTTCALGDSIKIVGKGAGGWRVKEAHASQQIVFGVTASTGDGTGYYESSLQRDCIELICTETDNEFTIINSVGDITVV